MSERILFLMHNLRLGGAERVFVRLANFASGSGHEVHVVCISEGGALAQDLSDSVRLHDLGVEHVRRAFGPVRATVKDVRPDVIVSTLPHVNVLASLVTHTLRPRPRLVVREANDPRHEVIGSEAGAWLSRYVYSAAYRGADRILAVSAGVSSGLQRAYGLPATKIVVLKNPSLDDRLFDLASASVDCAWLQRRHPLVITVGRFAPQKDHSTLLRAFARCDLDESAGLVLVGYGPLESNLRRESERLGLAGRVKFVTGESNPYRWMRNADLFVLSSAWEGSPNALVEAMALGLPVVSTNCESGPSEILADGRYGRLVPVGDVEAMADGIERALASDIGASRVRARAMEYHIDTVGPRILSELKAS